MHNDRSQMLIKNLLTQAKHGLAPYKNGAQSHARISLCAVGLCKIATSQTLPVPVPHSRTPVRRASSSSSTRWKTRQANDRYAREAKVQGLKSRAAWKLLEVRCAYLYSCGTWLFFCIRANLDSHDRSTTNTES